MNILHLSDIHFRMQYEKTDTGYLSALALMTSPLIHLDKCFEKPDRSNLDAVVITGDLSEDGSIQDYRALKLFLDQSLGDLPLIVTLGNHDNKRAFRIGWGVDDEGEKGMDEPYNSMLHVGDVTILSIDNSISGFPDGAIVSEQFHWLQNALNEMAGRKVVLVMHHHLLNSQADIPAASFQSDFSDLIRHSGILGILCGHTHYSFSGDFAGVHYTTAPSISFRAMRVHQEFLQFEEYPGYQICHFTEEGFSVETVYHYDQPRYLNRVPLSEMMSTRQ